MTPDKLSMVRITITKNEVSDRLACATGDFPLPRVAVLSWLPHELGTTSSTLTKLERCNVSE